jgi:hypothetical protein
MSIFDQFYWLIVIHFIADFQLQTDYIAKTKKPRESETWIWSLTAHSALHSAGVTLILSPFFGLLEWIAHWLTDYLKSVGRFGNGSGAFVIDQFLHIGVKAIWLFLSIKFPNL